MTGAVMAALIAAANVGESVDLDTVGTREEVAVELPTLAATPAAPLAATALADALAAPGGHAWAPTAVAFATRLAEQTSVLALADTVDALLDQPDAAAVTAGVLHAATIEGVAATVSAAPLLAAQRLEAALRVSLAGAASPYTVLGLLAAPVDDQPDDYAEALPRLLGAALDAWDGDRLADPLIEALRALIDHAAAGPGAVFELGCHRMRAALRDPDPASAAATLVDAAKRFESVSKTDDGRDDAAAYAHVCAAVAAFAAGDAPGLADRRDQLAVVMARRRAWHLNTHVPAWRRPLLEAEAEWLALVVDLAAAADRLTERSWLDTAAALGQLARVYVADRSTTPAPGLAAMVRPAVENAIAANAIVLDQLARAIDADRNRPSPVLPPAASDLLAVIRDRAIRTRGPRLSARDNDDEDTEGDPPPALTTTIPPAISVPTQLRILGDDVAAHLAQRLPPERLDEIVDLLAGAAVTGVGGDPTLRRIREDVVAALASSPRFTHAETRGAVVLLLDHTLRFLQNRYNRNGPMWTNGPNPTRLLVRGEDPPREKELQQEFYYWLANSAQFASRVRMEVSDIAGGRVDVIVRVGEIELVTEIKRELDNPSPASLSQYVPQAAQYAGAGIPFSQLLVLDLTDHTSGWPPLPELVWAVEHRPQADSSPLHVVIGVVIGNKPTPRQLTASHVEAG